jgi:hypothetical protein
MSRYSIHGRARFVTALALMGALASCYAGTYDTDYPPAVYVSTAPPVYYQGRPVYWYHDHWYYRDYRGWRHYPSEPAYLHEHRRQHAYYYYAPPPHSEWRR